jgi:hypothetical protein
MNALLSRPSLYQFRLVLAGISPMIWRRLVISSETSIAQLHEYIQIAFDWSGEHLHSFRIHGKDYGIAYLGGISFDDNPRLVRLSHFRLHPRESFRYEYDFTANWRVDIGLEKILPPDGCLAPICSAGRGAAPGEEYAGPLEYLQRLERHRYEFPFEELGTMAAALRGWLAEGRDQRTINDLEGLREAAERVTAYQEFQPQRCSRRQMNRNLQAISQEAV